MSINAEFRKASEADIQGIVDCYNCANSLFPSDERPQLDLDGCRGTFQQNENYVAVEKQMVIGWLSFKIVGENCVLSGLYIHENYQRQGIGERLSHLLEKVLRERNTKSISCKVLINASWSEKFYIKQGYIVFRNNGESEECSINDDLRDFFEREKHKTHSRILYKVLPAN